MEESFGRLSIQEEGEGVIEPYLSGCHLVLSLYKQVVAFPLIQGDFFTLASLRRRTEKRIKVGYGCREQTFGGKKKKARFGV